MAEPPSGYHTVTPRIAVADVAAQVEFLRAVFDAVGEVPSGRPAEITIGDSLVMIGSIVDRHPFPAFLYVYVDDVDETYARAVEAPRKRSSHRSTRPTEIEGQWCATRSATSSRSLIGSEPATEGSPRSILVELVTGSVC